MAEQIIINLDEERDAYVVSEPEDIIHINEFARIRDLLKDSLVAAKKFAKSKSYDGSSKDRTDNCRDKKERCRSELLPVRRHDTIMLAGVRGSGKTTFMLSILDFIEKGKIGINIDGKKNEECEIESLHILDPTLIEDKTHIFINIISMIKDKVDVTAKKSNCFNNEKSELSRKYEIWEKSFRKLAEGLPSIDGLGADGFNTDSWLDAEFVMNTGVRRAHAAYKLEESFREYVRCSLEFIDKNAFILCFDDIDTNFGKGWPVLEVLHKYLTTPQMITVLSGDPSLYSILIRDQQWSNFSDRLLRMEGRTKEGRQQFKETVAHLEEQYFLKLLKPERRVFLNNLYQIEQQDKSNAIKVRYIDESGEGETLYNTYLRLMDKFGIGRSDRSDSYRFLATLPLRTQKQLLYAFVKQEKPREGDTIRDLLQDVIDIFWSDLTVKQVDISSLRSNPKNISTHTLNYLVLNNILSEGYTLNQNFNEPLINGAQFALGTILHDQVTKNPSQVFEYWMRVCMARELGVLMGDRVVSRGEVPSLQNFIDHCALNQNKATRYLARFCTAYFRAFRAFNYATKGLNQQKYDEKAWHGTLPLYGLAEKLKGSSEESKNRIDHVLYSDGVHPFIRVTGSLPLSGATDHNKRALPIYSIYNIIGILGQLINVARENKNDIEKASKEVASLMYRDAQFREYPLPNWASSYSAEQIETAAEIQSSVKQFDATLIVFAKRIVLWSLMNINMNISASILGKVFTRLFYTLNNLDKQYSEPLLGEWLHRMVVIFQHSVVVVEAMEQLDISTMQLHLTNPVTSDKVFIENLGKINVENILNNDQLLPLSKWMLSCPLWDIYMKPDIDGNKLKAHIGSFTSTYVASELKNLNIAEDEFKQDCSELNLCVQLNSSLVCVKGHELKAETSNSDVGFIDGQEQGVEADKSVEFSKPMFTLTANKIQLLKKTLFDNGCDTLEKLKGLKRERLLEIIGSTPSLNKYKFTNACIKRILSKISSDRL